MNKTTVEIKGMHCRSCELLVEEKLREVAGVERVRVSWRKSSADIFSDGPLDKGSIGKAVTAAGYEVGSGDSGSWISRDPKVYRDLAIAVPAILILYLIAGRLGIFEWNVTSGNPSNLLVVLVVGLTAGFSSCMALVGGLVLGISARHAEKHPAATRMQNFRPHLFFNLGRIISFAVLGGLVGLLGRVFHFSGPVLGVLIIVVGLVMFFIGLQLTDLFPRLSSGGLTLPPALSRLLGTHKRRDDEYGHANSMLLGGLTFFLPCGFTQAMQLYAMSTGSFVMGALVMGIFAVGTTPGLLGIGGLTSYFKVSRARWFFRFAGVLVVALAMFNISNGYNLTGWDLFDLGDGTAAQAEAGSLPPVEGGYQVVNMAQVSSGYRPNQLTVQVGTPVRWVIDGQSPNSCASSLQVPKLGIVKSLSPGENVIEFTPQETGEIKFSCTMGMHTGRFIVVDGSDPGAVPPPTEEEPAVPAPCMPCCG